MSFFSQCDPGTRRMYQCDGCPRREELTRNRAFVSGWVAYDYTTLGGEHVKRTLCPYCHGVEKPKWDAVCDACGSSVSDDWDEEAEDWDPSTDKDAKAWMKEHECEPSVRLIKPKGYPSD